MAVINNCDCLSEMMTIGLRKSADRARHPWRARSAEQSSSAPAKLRVAARRRQGSEECGLRRVATGGEDCLVIAHTLANGASRVDRQSESLHQWRTVGRRSITICTKNLQNVHRITFSVTP